MPRLQFSVEKAITGKALTNPMKLQVRSGRDLLAGLHLPSLSGWCFDVLERFVGFGLFL